MGDTARNRSSKYTTDRVPEPCTSLAEVVSIQVLTAWLRAMQFRLSPAPRVTQYMRCRSDWGVEVARRCQMLDGRQEWEMFLICPFARCALSGISCLVAVGSSLSVRGRQFDETIA